MKTAEEIAEKYVLGNHDALTDNQEIKDMAADIEEYASIKAEQARREERGKSFEMLEKWSILNKEHYRDVSGLIQKTREIIERDKAIIGYDPVLKCKCEMPAKIHGKNLCWRCKRPLS
jgi:hypothetical protein